MEIRVLAIRKEVYTNSVLLISLAAKSFEDSYRTNEDCKHIDSSALAESVLRQQRNPKKMIQLLIFDFIMDLLGN
jgi:hypothetical protein